MQKTLTYRKGTTRDEAYRIVKAVGIPFLIFCLSLYTIDAFATFGLKLICPLIGAMWVVGVFVAFLLPPMRGEVLSQTLITIASYCGSLLTLRIALKLVSGVSAEMIAASYDQAITTASGNMLPGYVQNFLWVTTLMVPLAFLGLQGKRLLQFRRTASLQKMLGRTRKYRTNQ